MAEQTTHMRPLYAVTIHDAAASGELAEMKKVAASAEEHLAQYGDVGGALDKLKSEIAKMEGHK